MKLMDLLATTAAELRAAALGWFGARKGAGVAAAIYRQAVRQGVLAPQEHGLRADNARVWLEHAQLRLPKVIDEQTEVLPTGILRKRTLQFAPGRSVETVHLPMGRSRSSLCLSTQVGCARACTFCDTGKMGLLSNLTAGEIVAQVTLQHRQRRPDTLVFQGMGEPLDNLDAVLSAIRTLTDPAGLAYAHDRLTVCTVGHVPGLERLTHSSHARLNLSLSLHAGNDQLRGQLLPHAKRYELAEIHLALQRFRRRKNLALGVHWCLLPGINDSDRDADELAAFCSGLGRVWVHVIPYNPGREPIAAAPTDAEVARFVGLLRARQLAVRTRRAKGRSVLAACGQLASRATS